MSSNRELIVGMMLQLGQQVNHKLWRSDFRARQTSKDTIRFVRGDVTATEKSLQGPHLLGIELRLVHINLSLASRLEQWQGSASRRLLRELGWTLTGWSRINYSGIGNELDGHARSAE